jgi:hypothetical protein
MPSELLERLNERYDERPAREVMRGQRSFRRGLGRRMDRVDNVVVHLTAGWPRRARISVFTDRFTWTAACDNCCAAPLPRNGTDRKCGIGPQFFITYDGTTAVYLELPRKANHASWVNDWSLGVETGNLFRTGRPPRSSTWQAASPEQNDIPGARLWISGDDEEVLPGWWTTTAFTGPSRGRVAEGTMLFSEWQYRAWAALARHLAEQFRLPRNFPLLPHAVREDLNTDSVKFRRMILADERAEVLLRIFAARPIDIPEDHFEESNAAALRSRYSALAVAQTSAIWAQNLAYRRFFEGDDAQLRRNRVPGFRGFHGHGFSGAVDRPNDPKVDCPGPLFDFFRLAREVWDWWWYPFDAEAGSTHVARRGYRRWRGDTPLLEYYWDEAEATRSERRTEGIHGTGSSPATFRLEPASPVYALANGDLIAARFPAAGTGVSGAFALVRHEVFHLPRTAGPGPTAPGPGEIDFDRSPSYIYSLYYHLGRPEGMTFDAVHDGNPDWLNRVLIRKKECDLGVAFYGRSNHGGIPQASWDSRPPGVPERPTTLEGWQEDQQALGTFLTALREGRTAVVQRGPRIQPIRIILGDLLGDSGVIRRQGGIDTHGVRVEVFSPSFSPPGFQQTDTADWSPPRDATSPSLRYVSEWARATGVDDLQAIGVDPEHTAWWWSVVPAMQGDTLLPAEARLPLSGVMFHVDPLDFMRWINEVTWRHEWPKYEVTDAAGNAVPVEDAAGNLRRPRSRRI